jgi:hypothetical protein
MPVGDAAFRQVIRRQLDRHPIARQDFDEVLAHLSRQVSEDFMAFGDLHPEGGIRQRINHDSLDGNHIVFRNTLTPLTAGLKNQLAAVCFESQLARGAEPGLPSIISLEMPDENLPARRRFFRDKLDSDRLIFYDIIVANLKRKKALK